MSIELVPLAQEHADELRRIHQTPEVLRWWGEMDPEFPFDEPESERFAILHEGRIAGLVQIGEETQPDYRHAWIDVFVDPALHGRGVGTEAVRQAMRRAIDVRGHHRVTIDPSLYNVAAVRSYEKAGFRAVGVLQASWRNPQGEWEPSLLMERVELPVEVNGAAK